MNGSATNFVLVLAYGNPLRGDDAAGWLVAELLRDQPGEERLKIITAHQLLPEHVADAAVASLVCFVDASVQIAPGEVGMAVIFPSAQTPQPMAHDMQPGDVLAMCADLYGRVPPAELFTIGASEFGFDAAVSPAVREGCRRAAAMIRARIDAECCIPGTGG